MPTFYDVTVTADLPAAGVIEGKACTVVFSYPEGSFSHPYSGTVVTRSGNRQLRMSSAVLNIEAGWDGANGGTITIAATGGNQDFAIDGFVKVAEQFAEASQ